jgi:hypothetical protein
VPKPPGRHAGRSAGVADRTAIQAISARVNEALAGGSDEILARLTALGADTPGGLATVIEALATMRNEDAARALSIVAADGPDKDLRKAARRGLHRLRAAGLAVTLPSPARGPETPPPASDARRGTAEATAPDGAGSRVLWLAIERPLGGLDAFGLVLNDVIGVTDCTYRDTTRRRLTSSLSGWRADSDTPTVELPIDYALALLSEALQLNAESGTTVPTELQIHRRLLGDLPPPPTEALIHRHVSRGQALLMPNLLDESGQLFEEEELGDWFFEYDRAIGRARELQQVRESRIVLSGEPREQRERRILDSTIAELFTPPLRRAIRRRLEEVAYLFWATGRERSARRAVAAAFALGDGSLASHPFARAMVEKSLDFALQAERAGIDPARLRRSPNRRVG